MKDFNYTAIKMNASFFSGMVKAMDQLDAIQKVQGELENHMKSWNVARFVDCWCSEVGKEKPFEVPVEDLNGKAPEPSGRDILEFFELEKHWSKEMQIFCKQFNVLPRSVRSRAVLIDGARWEEWWMPGKTNRVYTFKPSEEKFEELRKIRVGEDFS